MNKKLKEALLELEPEMGLAGILSEVSSFAINCASDAIGCGDKESAKTYREDAAKIQSLAAKIRENDR